MKLNLVNTGGLNAINGYGPGYVLVNGRRRERSLVVLPDLVIDPWEIPAAEALTPAHLEAVLAQGPEIILLGTGAPLRLPPVALIKAANAAGVGLETMDSGAACRTYNIIMAEGRRVAAALVL